MSEIGELQLGPLRLRAPASWQFSVFGNMILARRDDRQGAFQITLAYAADVPGQGDHEQCLAQLHRFINEPEAEVQYTKRSDQTDAVFGHVTIHDLSSFRRYWYRCTEVGLVLALYQCKVEKFAAADVEIQEAQGIAETMRLERQRTRGL